jgi:hypothetical protein
MDSWDLALLGQASLYENTFITGIKDFVMAIVG